MANPIKEVPMPGLAGKPGGLGQKIETTIQRAFALLLNAARETVIQIISGGLSLVLEVVERSLAPKISPLLNEALQTPNLPPSVVAFLNDLKNPTAQGDAIGIGGFAGSMGMSAASGMMAPLMRLLNYSMDYRMKTARPDPSVAWPMKWRGVEHADWRDGLKQLGWDDAMIDGWGVLLRPRPSVADLVRYVQLSDKDFALVQDEMAKRGFLPEDIAKTIEIFKMVPGPGDLIGMAVREAFDDRIAATWGYDQDFPPEFAKWMQRQGDRDGWAQKYWRSHWQMPGVTTALEAFHRLPDFDLDKLDTFLRVSDIAPAWRDIIKRIAYTPLTRVDVRRMYGMGVLNREAVVRSYLDLGYSPENAEKMTEFTVKYESNADRELTKADILGGFGQGMLSETETQALLNSIGYPDSTAQFLIARERADVQRKLTDKQTKSIKTLYVNKDLNESQARVRLAALNLASTEIDVLLEDWRIDRDAKVKRPTQAQLDTFLKDDIIGIDEYKQGLSALGLQDKYIDWYSTHVLADKAADAVKAEQAARDEQQKIRDRKVKSDYQVDKAGLDVNITELRTAIAETQVARSEREDRYRRELGIVRGLVPMKELQARATADIAGWEAEITDARDAESLLREQIDGFETEIATINLELARQKEELAGRVEAATSEAEATRVQGDAARQELAWKRQIREYELEKETLQDQIATLETTITGLRARIADRKSLLQQEIAVAEKAKSEIALTEAYQAEIEAIETRLSELRLNLSRLLEDKARLAVEYRQGLA